jgi:hypothetical protein
MNTKRFSITIIAAAVTLMLTAGLAAAEPRFEPDRTKEDMAQFQIIKKELIQESDSRVVLDFETMTFLEDNTWTYASGRADLLDFRAMIFLEDNTWTYDSDRAGFLTTGDTSTTDTLVAYTSPCQGEGLVSNAEARTGISGLIKTYCSFRAQWFGDRDTDVVPAIPLHPDWPDGGLYDTPDVTAPVPQHPDWPYGIYDY